MTDSQQPQGSANGPGLDWMYKGPAALVNREDYLLGRSVDKSLKILEETEKGNAFSYAEEVEKDLTPASIFASRGPSGPVDVIRKIKEDPLYQIQKKEEESLKQLLKNPVRMKQLQQLAEQREKESSSRKNKKKHKRKHSPSDSSDSDSKLSAKNEKKRNINKFLAEKLNSYKKILEESSSSSSSDSEDESSRKRRKRDHHKSESKSSRSQSHSSRDDHVRRDDVRDRERDRGFRNSSPYKSGSRNRDYSSRDRREIAKSSSSSTSNSQGYDRNNWSSSSSRSSQPSEKRKALDEAEMERKRLEMMENAKWRENQLSKNVSKYREQERKEEEKSSTKHDRDPDFIRKQLIKAASTGSVEQRIKSNSYNIQRSKASMNQNFARR